MAGKMSAELKFQLEIAKKLYNDEIVNSLELHVDNFPTGTFGALLVGCGECFRKITKNVIAAVELYNPYDIYTHCIEKLDGAAYVEATIESTQDIGSPKRKKIITKLAAKNGKRAFVQERHLTNFEENVIFFIKDEYSPILIFLPNPLRIVGLVMPYVMKK